MKKFSIQGILGGVKEFFRKKIVGLKRNPKIIPLLTLAVAFLYYSLNLTAVSETTALIQGKGMGLCEFAVMLLSMLVMVCLLNAFPRRQKPNIPMLVLVYVMLAVIVFADITYNNGVMAALTRAESPIEITEARMFIVKAYNMFRVHQIIVIVGAVVLTLMPVYTKLLRMIKTSVEVEGNGDMANIEIADEA